MPATWALWSRMVRKVGIMSQNEQAKSDSRPGAMWPGHETIIGTRMPPS